jgi:hypothetical protein
MNNKEYFLIRKKDNKDYYLAKGSDEATYHTGEIAGAVHEFIPGDVLRDNQYEIISSKEERFMEILGGECCRLKRQEHSLNLELRRIEGQIKEINSLELF